MTESQADIVIIGGGIIGCSIAYHLAKAGMSDVQVLEKEALTYGSTWHAAGIIGQLRSSKNHSRMLQDSVKLYEVLEEETGHASSWRQTGSIRTASTPQRMLELHRSCGMAKSFDLEAAVISPAEARDLFPILETDGLLGALYVPSDGVADPSMITQSLAAGARRLPPAAALGTRRLYMPERERGRG